MKKSSVNSLKNSSVCIYEVFSFFPIHDLQRMQNLNSRFYKQTLPRLITRSPIENLDYSFSFTSDLGTRDCSIMPAYPNLTPKYMYVGNGSNIDLKFEIYTRIISRSNHLKGQRNDVRINIQIIKATKSKSWIYMLVRINNKFTIFCKFNPFDDTFVDLDKSTNMNQVLAMKAVNQFIFFVYSFDQVEVYHC